MKKIFFAIVTCYLLVACGPKTEKRDNDDNFDDIEVVDTDEEELSMHQRYIPTDFVTYIDSLFDSIPEFHHDEYHTMVLPTVKQLQAYKDGKRKYYPQEQIVDLLNYLQDEYAYACLHSTEENMDQLLLLFKSVLELAVRTTPDINLLSNICASDHRIGVLMFEDCFSYYPYYAVIYDVTDQDEFDVHWMSDEYQSLALTCVRLLEEDDYRLRYLITAEEHIPMNNLVYETVWLVDWYWETGEMKSFRADISAAEAKKWADPPEHDNVYYNPKERTWQYCRLVNGISQPITNAPILRFHLKPEGKGCYLTVE